MWPLAATIVAGCSLRTPRVCGRWLLVWLSGCAFTIIVGALGKLVPANWRATAFGFGTAAGSFGQFLYSPLAVALMDAYSWQTALTIFAGLMLLILPLSIALSPPRSGAANISVAPAAQQSLR